MSIPTLDVARWQLTGQVEGVSGKSKVSGRIVAKIVSSYIDADTGVTVLAVDPSDRDNTSNRISNGRVDITLPKGKDIALTVSIDHGPRLYKLITARTNDATVAEAVGAWETAPTWTSSGGGEVTIPIPNWSATYGG